MADQPKRVLIVEDERPIAKALELKLNHSGFEAKAVFDGEQALQMLESETFDVVLLDLMMPKTDGFAVLEELKKRGISVPVVVVSNLNQPEDIEKAKTLGAADFFIKSDTPLSGVVEHVKRVVGL
ncbi:MAG: response regulator [bacterium]|nr:response regulator [bacterium]